MGRIPRGLVAALLGPGLIGPAGCSTTRHAAGDPARAARELKETAEMLPGRWYDPSWKECVLSVESAGPDTFRWARVGADADADPAAREVSLVSFPDRSYLDIRGVDGSDHKLLKVYATHIYELSAETGTSAKKREFRGSPFKKYRSLSITSPDPEFFKAHPDLIRHEFRPGLAAKDPIKLVITATPAEIAAFLKDHGKDEGLWDDENKHKMVSR